MKSSINKKISKITRTALVLIFWVIVWHLIAKAIDRPVLVSTPADTFKNLIALASEKEFYIIIFSSVLRILSGFFSAVLVGTVIGILAGKIALFDELINPLMSVIKATPVASFIILALFWISKENIPSFIAFLMVVPIIHGNVREGLKNTSVELVEMTRIYQISPLKRLTKLYIPSILPYFAAGFKTSLGLAWKAGVAAEVIAYTKNSIGKELNSAKAYLETVDIFAWTVTVIIISIILEKLLMLIFSALTQRKRKGVSK